MNQMFPSVSVSNQVDKEPMCRNPPSKRLSSSAVAMLSFSYLIRFFIPSYICERRDPGSLSLEAVISK